MLSTGTDVVIGANPTSVPTPLGDWALGVFRH